MIDTLAIKPNWSAVRLANAPALEKGDLHLWCLPLTLNDDQADQAEGWLSDAQRDKYSRRNTPELKHAYLAGRYFLLRLLGHYSNCDPAHVELSYTRLNKPYLRDNTSHIHFNFTDTTLRAQSKHDTRLPVEAVGLYAFSCCAEVGVDVEHLSRRSDFKQIVEKRFTKAEQTFVTKQNGEIDPELFLGIWTRKEASGKATGQGINFQMNQRNLINSVNKDASQGNHAHLNYVDEEQRAWRLIQLHLENNLIGCVVHAGHQPLSIKAFNRLDI